MDEDQAALGLDLARALVGLVVVGPVQDDLGAVAPGRRHLDERRPLRHDDDGRDAETRGVEGDRQAMVARAGRDDPAPPLVGRELQEQLAAPRSLKEPVIWRFSSLTKTRAPVSAESVSEYGQGVSSIDAVEPRARPRGRRRASTARAIRTAAPARRGAGDMSPTGISGVEWRPAEAAAPVHEDEAALAAAFLDQHARRRPRRRGSGRRRP